jgi:hypothetical protein
MKQVVLQNVGTHCQVDSDDVSEPLLVIEEGSEVGDENDEGGGDVHGHEVTEDVSFENNLHRDSLHPVVKCPVEHSGRLEVVPATFDFT